MAKPPTGPPLFVLVADEDERVREKIVEVCQPDKLEVTAAASLTEASAEADRHQKLDILIADWVLPDGSGLDLASVVRKKHANCQIVLLGETGSYKLANELFPGGVQDFVRKPLPPQKELLKRLRRAVLAARRDGQGSGATVATTVIQARDRKSEEGRLPTIMVEAPADEKRPDEVPPDEAPPDGSDDPPESTARKSAPLPTAEDTAATFVGPHPELDAGDLDDPASADLESAFRMSFRSIPDFEPVQAEAEEEQVASSEAAAEAEALPFAEAEEVIDAEAESAPVDQDFQVDVSEPVSEPHFPKPAEPPTEKTAVFGEAGTTPTPPKAVRPKPSGDKTWVLNTEATGVFDPTLTETVWSRKLQYGTGTYFGLGKNDEPEEAYEIERELAQGRNATIYLARWPGEEASVALKVLAPHLSEDMRFRQRFRREIRSQAALRHQNIVKVHKYGRKGGSYFLALELMKGSLRDVLVAAGGLPTAVIAVVLQDLLGAAHFAHRRGVIHRDIKPSNLMFGYDGTVKLGDFHFAKNTLDPNRSQPGVRLGTPAYFSPEQAKGIDLDGRSDLFTIGTLLYEMVTERNPFDRGNDTDSMLAVGEVNIRPLEEVAPQVHPLLAKIAAKLLERRREDRYGSGNQVLEELGPLLKAVDRRYPELRRQFAQSPPAVGPQLLADEARLEVKRAQRLLDRGPDRGPPAVYAVQRALLLDPASSDARALFDELAKKHSYTEDPLEGGEFDELKARLEEDADDTEAVQALALRAREKRNMWLYGYYLRRYVRLVPHDQRAQSQLESLLGPNPYAPFVKDKKARAQGPDEAEEASTSA